MNRHIRSLLAFSSFFIACIGLIGCSGGGTTPPASAGVCDQNPVLFTTGTTYEVATNATSTRTGTGNPGVITQLTNSSTYKVLGLKKVGSNEAIDTNLSESSSGVLTNPDGSTFSFNETVAEDRYQSLDTSNVSTFGLTALDTTTSPTINGPTVISTQESISPAITAPVKPVLGTSYGPETVTITTVGSYQGLPPTTNVVTQTITRIYSMESVTVPAGTFQACKESDSSTSTSEGLPGTSQGTVTTWTVGTGSCRGLILKSTSTASGANVPNFSSTDETTALSLNGAACTN
jgi:hypothetical protein